MIIELRLKFNALTLEAEFHDAMKIRATTDQGKMVFSVNRDDTKKYDEFRKLIKAHSDGQPCGGHLILLRYQTHYELIIYSDLGNIDLEVYND